MFFMMGIMPKEKQLNFSQMVICGECGSYGRYEVFMTCMCLSLFFIPVFKWDRHYYVKTSCCGTVYELDAELGKKIAKGIDVEIMPEHLTKISGGNHNFWEKVRSCKFCGYTTEEDFSYCPKCGKPF